MKTLIFILVLFISFPVYSGEFMVHTATAHVGVTDVEIFTPGINYTNNDGYRFGILRNSYKLPGVYGAKIYKINNTTRFGIGIISGYSWDNGLKGDRDSVVPLFALEKDLTERISIIWFGQALNLEIKL